jgi:hypothetical protein
MVISDYNQEDARLGICGVCGMSDYLQYRGKCKELSEKLCADDKSLTLVRGWYHCPVWGKQAHWWTVQADGTVIDPTVRQFPTHGAGATYEPYDGTIVCEYCSKIVHEQDAYFVEHHAYCCGECYGHDIGF